MAENVFTYKEIKFIMSSNYFNKNNKQIIEDGSKENGDKTSGRLKKYKSEVQTTIAFTHVQRLGSK
jgi:hypothetical protein